MPAAEILRRILWRLDHLPEPALTFEDVRRWPAGLLDRFVELGIVRKGRLARSTIYYDCPDHCAIDLNLTEHPRTGKMVSLHRCRHDECGGLVVVDAEHFQLWDLVFEGLARVVSEQLDLHGKFESLVADRVVLLGTTFTGGGPLDVFMARALQEPDAATLFEKAPRLAASASAVVIVAEAPPAPGLWPDARPTVLALAEHLSWNEEQRRIDVDALRKALSSIRAPVPKDRWLTVKACAGLLTNDLPYLDLKRAAARVSKAAGAGKFVTNGKRGKARRIERMSFDAWRLEQRDRDLDDEEREHFGNVASRRETGRHRCH